MASRDSTGADHVEHWVPCEYRAGPNVRECWCGFLLIADLEDSYDRIDRLLPGQALELCQGTTVLHRWFSRRISRRPELVPPIRIFLEYPLRPGQRVDVRHHGKRLYSWPRPKGLLDEAYGPFAVLAFLPGHGPVIVP